jgi:hypothetical protein
LNAVSVLEKGVITWCMAVEKSLAGCCRVYHR